MARLLLKKGPGVSVSCRGVTNHWKHLYKISKFLEDEVANYLIAVYLPQLYRDVLLKAWLIGRYLYVKVGWVEAWEQG